MSVITNNCSFPQLSDQQEYPLTSSNPEIYDFLREVCDVVAYSELALRLSNQTDEELQGVLTTAAVSKYQELLSTVVQKTCSWVSNLRQNCVGILY